MLLSLRLSCWCRCLTRRASLTCNDINILSDRSAGNRARVDELVVMKYWFKLEITRILHLKFQISESFGSCKIDNGVFKNNSYSIMLLSLSDNFSPILASRMNFMNCDRCMLYQRQNWSWKCIQSPSKCVVGDSSILTISMIFQTSFLPSLAIRLAILLYWPYYPKRDQLSVPSLVPPYPTWQSRLREGFSTQRANVAIMWRHEVYSTYCHLPRRLPRTWSICVYMIYVHIHDA